jgi:hypothetical protein
MVVRTKGVITAVRLYQKRVLKNGRLTPDRHKSVLFFVHEDKDFDSFEMSSRQNEAVVEGARRLGALVITRDLLDQAITHSSELLQRVVCTKKAEHEIKKRNAFEKLLEGEHQIVNYSSLVGFAQQCRDAGVQVSNVETGHQYGFFINGSLYDHAGLLRSVFDKVKERLDYYEAFDKGPERVAIRTFFEPSYILGTVASSAAQKAIHILHERAPVTPEIRATVEQGLGVFNDYYINTSMLAAIDAHDTVFVCSHENHCFDTSLAILGYSRKSLTQLLGAGSSVEDRVTAAQEIDIPSMLSCLVPSSAVSLDNIVLPPAQKRRRLEADEEKNEERVRFNDRDFPIRPRTRYNSLCDENAEPLICNQDDGFSLLPGSWRDAE